jgi:hypothetical protein
MISHFLYIWSVGLSSWEILNRKIVRFPSA